MNCFIFILSTCLFALSLSLILDRTQLSQWNPNYQTASTLFLSNRSIVSIASDTFSDLTNLKVLYLERNELTSLEPTLFESLTSLQTLELENNKLAALDSSVFRNLNNLIDLWLSSNKLKS